jgi:hypothetical protein
MGFNIETFLAGAILLILLVGIVSIAVEWITYFASRNQK